MLYDQNVQKKKLQCLFTFRQRPVFYRKFFFFRFLVTSISVSAQYVCWKNKRETKPLRGQSTYSQNKINPVLLYELLATTAAAVQKLAKKGNDKTNRKK